MKPMIMLSQEPLHLSRTVFVLLVLPRQTTAKMIDRLMRCIVDNDGIDEWR